MKCELMGGICSPCIEVEVDVFVVLNFRLVAEISPGEVFGIFPTVVCDNARGILSLSGLFLIKN